MNGLFIKSSFLETIRGYGSAVVYHSLFGYPQILNNDAMSLLDTFSNGRQIEEVISKNNFESTFKQIEILKKCFFLVPIDFDERIFLDKKMVSSYVAMINNGKLLEYLSLIVSEECNFCCNYCISNSMIKASYRQKNRHRIMSFETAQLAVDTFLSILRNNGKKTAYINFGGGEPLLNWRIISKILDYCFDRYSNEFQFLFTINTNGSLVNIDIAKKLKLYNVEIALSLDGIETANNQVRVTKSGDGTFKKIIKAIDIFEKINYRLGGFSCTVTEKNFYLVGEELIKFAIQREFKEFRVDLDVIHMLKIPVREATEKLLSIKREAKKSGILVTGFWERPVENLNNSVLDKFIAFCGGVSGRSMCVSPKGEIFICGYSATKIADLHSDGLRGIINSPIYKNIIIYRLAGRVERCKGCSLEGICLGSCYITEEFSALNKNTALNYNCQLYRIITKELLKDSLREALAS